MRVSSLTLVSSLSGLLLLGGLSYSAEKKTDKSEVAPRETVAKPMSDKERRKRENQLRKELEGPYRKWLNEDVAYIITDEERQAFKRLATDEEKQSFIEQFWLRRDPTPGTAENEFKQEHYRRIAYANQRFGFESIAGWKTDRGRVYIVHGPPDEIESHPSRGEDAWLYHRIEGLGANVQFGFEGPEKRWAFYVDAQGRKLRFDGQR